MKISSAVSQPDGTLTHTVASPFQLGETKIHVLLPNEFGTEDELSVMYILPVEPHDGEQCGDPLTEVRKHDLHNRHRLIFVKPTFSHPPWYADHPTDPAIRQETYFLTLVVPFIDQTYCTPGKIPRRLLVGFSKSGWGAFSLILRHPQMFARAAAFDAPLAWQSPNRYGMAEVFETQANLDKYSVPELLEPSAAKLGSEARLGLYGYGEFRGHHQFLHYRLLHFDIPHDYADGPKREHRWDSGWLPGAVDFLSRQL
ncbi:MAG: hypothetical protein HY290_04160 [Planctomycetia bacterium]|nr:hypothetical protein [Planctomycetia bacterium]